MIKEYLNLNMCLNVADIEMEETSSFARPNRNTRVISSGCCMR